MAAQIASDTVDHIYSCPMPLDRHIFDRSRNTHTKTKWEDLSPTGQQEYKSSPFSFLAKHDRQFLRTVPRRMHQSRPRSSATARQGSIVQE